VYARVYMCMGVLMMADNEVRSARRIVLFLLEVCGVNLVSRCTRSPSLGSVLKFHVGEREKPRNHSGMLQSDPKFIAW